MSIPAQTIRATIFGASLQEFEVNGNKICNVYLHTYGPVEGEQADAYKGNAYSRLTCDKAVFERIKLGASPVELDLVVRLLPGAKNSMKLHVIDARVPGTPSTGSKAS